jgi:hypothetical protein
MADAVGPLARDGRGETYRTPDGKRVHLRTNQRFDGGGGRYSYWFGLDEDKWNPDEVFALACDTDALLIIPVREFMAYHDVLPQGGQDGRQRQPNIWFVDGVFQLRTRGKHISLNEWKDRFDLL